MGEGEAMLYRWKEMNYLHDSAHAGAIPRHVRSALQGCVTGAARSDRHVQETRPLQARMKSRTRMGGGSVKTTSLLAGRQVTVLQTRVCTSRAVIPRHLSVKCGYLGH